MSTPVWRAQIEGVESYKAGLHVGCKHEAIDHSHIQSVTFHEVPVSPRRAGKAASQAIVQALETASAGEVMQAAARRLGVGGPTQGGFTNRGAALIETAVDARLEYDRDPMGEGKARTWLDAENVLTAAEYWQYRDIYQQRASRR